MSIKGVVLLISLPVPILAGLFWHARAYSLYRSLADHVGSTSYYWFAFQLQNPRFARQLPGRVDLDALPESLSVEVSAVRAQLRRANLALLCWTILVFALIAMSFES
jgi:hypothetical protein